MQEQQFNAREIAEALGVSQQAVQRRATRGSWCFEQVTGRGGMRRLYLFSDLPVDAQDALVIRFPERFTTTATETDHGHSSPSTTPHETEDGEAFSSYDPEALWAHYERKNKRQRETAQTRLELLDKVMLLVDQGRGMVEALQTVGKASGTSWRTIQGWYHGTSGRRGVKHYHRSDWLAALVPGYVPRPPSAECSPEAWDYFKADYLRLEAPAAAACYDRLQRIAAERGWVVPSLRTLERRLAREIPRPAIILAREGLEAVKRTYPPQERDKTVFHALEAVNADGHKFDVFVRWPDGEIRRPIMVAWQDIYSGMLLSYRVDKTENTDSVRLSFGDLVERYGIPSHAFLDNGRSFASKHMTGGSPTRYRFKVREEDPVGILTIMGVKVSWATPYHGQAKPIERAFRDLCEYVAKHPRFSGAYTGNSPDAKPENYGSKAIPLDTFLEVLEQEVRAHNTRQGRRSSVCAGRSLDDAFRESYERAPIRRATAEQRRLWLLAADRVRADRVDGSVRLDKNRYWSEALAAHAGHALVVRFDPQAMHQAVHVYSLDGRYIGLADCIQAAGFNDSQAAREHTRLRQQNTKAAQRTLMNERRMTAIEAADLLPTLPNPEPLENQVTAPVFGRVQQVAGSDVVDGAAASQGASPYGFDDLMRDRLAVWIRNQPLATTPEDDQ